MFAVICVLHIAYLSTNQGSNDKLMIPTYRSNHLRGTIASLFWERLNPIKPIFLVCHRHKETANVCTTTSEIIMV